MRVAALALVLTFGGACSSSGEPNLTPPLDRTSQELDILETVFRFQLERETRDTHEERYLLSLSGGESPWKDPPAELLARFRGDVPSVDPISIAGPDVGSDVHGGVRPGIILDLTEIRRLDRDTAEVYGSYYSNLRASADSYRVERRAGAWVVVKDGMRGVY